MGGTAYAVLTLDAGNKSANTVFIERDQAST